MVGGQGINLWAIIYLDKDGRKGAQPGSHDMDVVSSAEALSFLKTLKDSPIPKIANACKHQLPRVTAAGVGGAGKTGPQMRR